MAVNRKEKGGIGTGEVPIISLAGIGVSFGPVRALSDVALDILPGECVGVVGHNGAGKSTLVNVINGRLSPTAGDARYDGAESRADFRNGQRARQAGIRSVFQELSLCPNLTVLENMRIPYRNMPWRNWRGNAASAVRMALDAVFPGHGIDPYCVVGDLSIAERQMVEIAIAFSRRDIDARLVILDEPTSSLDGAIADQLLAYIKKFCADGGSVIFISHMLGEIFDVATRMVVMKDGRIIANDDAKNFTRDSLVDAMGHVVPDGAENGEGRKQRELGEDVLRMKNGLSARKGEIVGLAGLAGHGQAEALAQCYLERSSDWRANRAPAVVFVAGDRARDGVMPLWSILRNLSLQTLVEFSRSFLVDRAAEKKLAQDWHRKIKIKTDDLDSSILSLSGGNQQKVLFSRALASSAPIVVMDDPMRGVDVGTKKEVYRMVREEAEKGRTFLWYSTETDEILECDRVFVFRDGEIAAELTGDAITEENMLRASFEMEEAAS
ncbi:sugar ABC transporter ATP-binding protein [Thalassospira profundimaris]|uniref:sugar ABC transporter ATP-binding protein n=1 Tax=Thalassospira profundimaris TaxID=502049 RepID=UPI000DEDC0D2|nr:sugar ABC transporter ATP-binding protein [Thalassospira profundimaris]